MVDPVQNFVDLLTMRLIYLFTMAVLYEAKIVEPEVPVFHVIKVSENL